MSFTVPADTTTEDRDFVASFADRFDREILLAVRGLGRSLSEIFLTLRSFPRIGWQMTNFDALICGRLNLGDEAFETKVVLAALEIHGLTLPLPSSIPIYRELSPAHQALEYKRLKMARALLERGDSFLYTEYGVNILPAVTGLSTDYDLADVTALTKLLIDRGADVNKAWVQNAPPLLSAILRGHPEVVQIVLSNGFHVNKLHGPYGNDSLLDSITVALGVGFSTNLDEPIRLDKIHRLYLDLVQVHQAKHHSLPKGSFMDAYRWRLTRSILRKNAKTLRDEGDRLYEEYKALGAEEARIEAENARIEDEKERINALPEADRDPLKLAQLTADSVRNDQDFERYVERCMRYDADCKHHKEGSERHKISMEGLESTLVGSKPSRCDCMYAGDVCSFPP